MKHLYISILLLLTVRAMPAQDTFQLAPPLLKFPSVFFSKEISVQMAFAEPNTQIRYTLNGQEPNEKAPVYTAPLRITKNLTTVKARVFGKKYKPSDVVQATFIKDGLPIKSLESTIPNPKYAGSGTTTLLDNQGGNPGISGSTWLGFQTDTVDITFTLEKKQRVKKVLTNLLRDHGSWIFLPQKMEVYCFDPKKNSYQLIENHEFKQDSALTGAACIPFVFMFKNGVTTDKIKLRLHLLKKLPDWHAGRGNKGWIFIDEVKVYGE